MFLPTSIHVFAVIQGFLTQFCVSELPGKLAPAINRSHTQDHSQDRRKKTNTKSVFWREFLVRHSRPFLFPPLYRSSKLHSTNSVHAARLGRRELFSRRPMTRTASTHIVGSRAQDSDSPTDSTLELTNLTAKLPQTHTCLSSAKR
jgi:hypothetical protein